MRALIRELIETVILALIIFLALQFSVQNFKVEGSSMQTTIEPGQFLLVNKLVYFNLNPRDVRSVMAFTSSAKAERVYPFHAPRRTDVVIFHFPRDPSRDFVKRVIGLPGETIEIDDGFVFINGTKLDEPYITSTKRDTRNMKPLTVGDDAYFVMGDNRRASNDSRDWGTVPTALIIGRAWVSYWPLDRLSTLTVSSGLF